jgi:hypothetical protein
MTRASPVVQGRRNSQQNAGIRKLEEKSSSRRDLGGDITLVTPVIAYVHPASPWKKRARSWRCRPAASFRGASSWGSNWQITPGSRRRETFHSDAYIVHGRVFVRTLPLGASRGPDASWGVYGPLRGGHDHVQNMRELAAPSNARAIRIDPPRTSHSTGSMLSSRTSYPAICPFSK